MHSYDSYGWLSSSPIAGRETDVEPPPHGAFPVVGEPWPNFTGSTDPDKAWIMVPYSEPVIPAPVVERITKLTRLDYLSRFTNEEAVAIDLASIGATPEAAMLRRMTNMVNNAEFIDLDDPRTIGGVQMLESAGLIAAGRAAEILS